MGINWHIERREISSLKEFADNPRRLKTKELANLEKSIERFGLAEPLVINTDGTICGGHGRLKILQRKNITEVDCYLPDRTLSKEEFKELNIRLNVNIAGEWDFDILSSNFELEQLREFGFDDKTLQLWEGDAELEDVEPQIDKAEELRVKWGLELGQLWELGEHRLICGDCTDRAVVERVMGGGKAVLMNTDPPYGIKYDSTTGKPDGHKRKCPWDTIENDEKVNEDIQPFLESCFGVSKEIALKDNAAWYLWHAHLTGAFFAAAAAAAADVLLHRQIIWCKPRFIIGRGDYHWQHEPCFMGWVRGSRPPFYGERNQTTVWCLDYDGKKNPTDRVHPTQKPLRLFEIPIENHSQKGDVVYEPFSGSGSQIIAAEKLNRKCRAIEISPGYCAVAIQRWVDVAGKEPRLLNG